MKITFAYSKRLVIADTGTTKEAIGKAVENLSEISGLIPVPLHT